MKTIYIILISLSVFHSAANAQIEKMNPADVITMRQYEDTLRWLGDSVAYSNSWEIREAAAVQMVRTLVQALKTPNSFYFPFDSQMMITSVYPESNSFRIITWPMKLKDHTYRYYGAVQMNTPELKIFPLIDMSLFIEHSEVALLCADNWYGAYYYNIKEIKRKKQTYYLLFGWDGVDDFSTRKIVDVLWFDEHNKPQFGLPVFYISDNDIRRRFFIEFKEDASPTLNYDENYKMIIFDYLRPENPMSDGIFMTYIPDGTYMGFAYDKKENLWRFQQKVFDHTYDKAPINKPKYEGEDPNLYQKADN